MVKEKKGETVILVLLELSQIVTYGNDNFKLV